MKKFYKIFSVLLLTIFANKVVAAPANTAFTDDQFYNCIILKLNTDGFNSVHDRDAQTYEVTNEELQSITVLKCNESSISNVAGLEKLINLTDLNLSDNNISSINLASNTKITNLLLSNNKLSTIDLSKNVELENLYLNGNSLTSLNLSKNADLLVLNVNNNKLQSLNLENNTKIIDLKATESAFAVQTKYLFKGESLTLEPDIKIPEGSAILEEGVTPAWSTKDGNIIPVNQKGTVTATQSGSVNVTCTIENVYSITYNIVAAELTSDTYNIDDINSTIAVDNASISTILKNIKVVNGEALIYNTSNKNVTSGNITTGFKLKVMKNGQALKTYTLTLVSAVVNNDLESLEIKDYSIEFDKDVTSYTIIVEKDVEEVTVKAKAVESSAKVTIEGGKDLQPGSNQVIVTVTGTDKTTKTYTINVIKKSDEVTPEVEPKASARLGKLEIKDYEIKFDPNNDLYTIKIPEEVTALEITAEPEDIEASIEIKGNHDLKNKSKVEIVVTATDETTKTYTIEVQKNSSENMKLILIILISVALSLFILLCIILISKHSKKKKVKAKKESKVVPKEENESVESDDSDEDEDVVEKTIVASRTQSGMTRSERYLEKTIRFRRVCPKCGSINVLTNDTCYLCGEKLDGE